MESRSLGRRRRFNEAFSNVNDREDNPRLILRRSEFEYPALPPADDSVV